MPTIQEILNYVDRKYSNTESIANKVIDLNDINIKAYIKTLRLKNQYNTHSFFTSSQLEYPLPQNCRIENIVEVQVSKDTTVKEFDKYKYAGLNDNIESGNYYGRSSEGAFFYVIMEKKSIL